jgi:tRNA/tmRNA/rRNA uracil-C5-methylase (TrmA/RlmC/RlmD family)
VPITDCVINALWTKNVISAFTKYIEEFDIKGYSETDNSGEIREITVKEIKGNLIITIVALSENIENFYDAGNDSQAERAIDNINTYIDLGIYYDKSVTRQADVIMDYYVETDDYNDFTWYEIEPIIKFPDGSKYAVYEYFDEDSFSGLSNSFDLWLSLYETMLEHYFE